MCLFRRFWMSAAAPGDSIGAQSKLFSENSLDPSEFTAHETG